MLNKLFLEKGIAGYDLKKKFNYFNKNVFNNEIVLDFSLVWAITKSITKTVKI